MGSVSTCGTRTESSTCSSGYTRRANTTAAASACRSPSASSRATAAGCGRIDRGWRHNVFLYAVARASEERALMARRMRVLLVEDNPGDVDLIRDTLEDVASLD